MSSHSRQFHVNGNKTLEITQNEIKVKNAVHSQTFDSEKFTPNADIYVATDGNDANSGTKSSPLLTISQAVTNATDGQTIFVERGTYSLSGAITISKKLTIYGLNGSTTINAASGQAAFDITSTDVELNSLVIDGDAESALIVNSGAGAGNSSIWPRILNSTIKNATSSVDGGGVRVSGGAVLANLQIENCSANSSNNGGGVSLDSAGGTLRNCLVRKCDAGGGGGVSSAGDCEITNCVIVENDASGNGTLYGGGFLGVDAGSTYTITNSVIYFNTKTSSVTENIDNTNGTYDVKNCVVTSPDFSGESTNISAVPEFVDRNNGDFHANTDSNLVNAGRSLSFMTDPVEAGYRELEGRLRTIDEKVDIGVYQTGGVTLNDNRVIATTGRINDLTVSDSLTITSFSFPSSDGSSGQVMVTDGAGSLSFEYPSDLSRVRFVDPEGDNTVATGVLTNPFSTIQAALDDIGQPSDSADQDKEFVVSISPGDYSSEDVSVPEARLVTLRSSGQVSINSLTIKCDTNLELGSATPVVALRGDISIASTVSTSGTTSLHKVELSEVTVTGGVTLSNTVDIDVKDCKFSSSFSATSGKLINAIRSKFDSGLSVDQYGHIENCDLNSGMTFNGAMAATAVFAPVGVFDSELTGTFSSNALTLDNYSYRSYQSNGASGGTLSLVGFGGITSSTDNALVRFDGTSGDKVQNSGVTLDDSDAMSGVANLTLDSGGNVDTSSGTLNLGGTNAGQIDIGYNSTAKNINLGGSNDTVTVSGDFTVSGTTTTVNSETLTVNDNQIVINDGESGDGVTAGVAGLKVDRGTLTNYLFQFNETSDTFRIGEDGSTQAVATRQDAPTADGIPHWNSVDNRFDTSSNLTFSSQKLNGVLDSDSQFTIEAANSGTRFSNVGSSAGPAVFASTGDIQFVSDLDNNGSKTFTFNKWTGTSLTELGRLDANGNLGLGTTNPQNKLHIDGGRFRLLDGNARIDIKENTAATGGDGFVGFIGSQDGLDLAMNMFNTTSNVAIRFTHQGRGDGGDVELMRIDDTGEVGIGTNSPSELLDVNGNINSSGNLTLSGTVTANKLRKTATQTINSAGWYRIATNGSVADGAVDGTNAAGRFQLFDSTTGGNGLVEFRAAIADTSEPTLTLLNALDKDTTGDWGAVHQVRLLQGDTAGEGSAVEVYIDLGGQASVDVTVVLWDNEWTAGWTLESFTSASVPTGFTAHTLDFSTSSLKWAVKTDTGDLLALDRNGNLGIGTSSPAYKFHVDSGTVIVDPKSDGGALYLHGDGSAADVKGNVSIRFAHWRKSSLDASNSGQYPGVLKWEETGVSDYTGDFVFELQSQDSDAGTMAEVMRIAHDGNVGIKQPAPDVSLTIREVSDPGAGTTVPFIHLQRDPAEDSDSLFGDGSTSSIRAESSIRVTHRTLATTPKEHDAIIFAVDGTGNPYEMRMDFGKLEILGTPGNADGTEDDFEGYHPYEENLRLFRPLNLEDVDAITVAIGTSSGASGDGESKAPGRMHLRASSSQDSNNDYGKIADTDVMTLVGDGNVGIGTNNPAKALHVESSNNTPVRFTSTNTGAGPHINLVDAASNESNIAFIGDGTVGYEGDTKSNPIAVRHMALEIQSTVTNGRINFTTGGGIVTSPDASVDANGNFYVQNSSSTTGEGGLVITQTTDTENLSGYGVFKQFVNDSSDGTGELRWYHSTLANVDTNVNQTLLMDLDDSGNLTVQGNITGLSDRRYKSNIETLDSSLEKVMKLRGVSFNKNNSDKRDIGFIAQELEEVVPEVVSKKQNEEQTRSVAYGNMTALLLEAIKELNQKIDNLK